MTNPLDFIENELTEIQDKGLYRKLRSLNLTSPVHGTSEGEDILLFCSNDYLGFTFDSDIKNSFASSLAGCGTGSGSARLISGTRDKHQALEKSLAEFLGREAALLYSSGYLVNLGILSSLFEKDDLIVFDKLSHASLIDAARLSEADYRVYPHKNLDRLHAILSSESARRRKAIVTDSVFSMDGDIAPLKALIKIKERHNAILIVDEAHGFGVFGENGKGAAEKEAALKDVDIYIGTLSKAVGLMGGFVSGEQKLINYLINRSRTFIYDTALPPGIVEAARVAVEKIRDGRARKILWENVLCVRDVIKNLGYGVESVPSPIIPIVIGNEQKALDVSGELMKKGIFIPAVRYPTVAKGSARLRVTVSAAHTAEDIDKLKKALESIKGS